MAEGITKPLTEACTQDNCRRVSEIICEPSGLLMVHNSFIKFDAAFCDLINSIHSDDSDLEEQVMQKIDFLENVFIQDIRPLIPDVHTFAFINQSILSKISFLGDALESGETKETIGRNVAVGDMTWPVLSTSKNASLYLFFSIIISMLIKFFAIVHGFEIICSRVRGFSLITDQHRLQIEKENIAMGGSRPKVMVETNDSAENSSSRLKAEELRILKSPAVKRSFDLRCFVLSKNMFTSAAERLQREWASSAKVAATRMKLRKNIDLFDRLRRDITVNLGAFVFNKESFSAYSLLLDWLTSLRYEFVLDAEELLSFFTCHPAEGNRYFEHVRMCIRYLDGIVSRGSVRYVGSDNVTCLSRIGTVRLEAHEELNFIIHSLIAVLHCIRALVCHEITPRVLAASVNECFLEVLTGKMCPKWNEALEVIRKDAVSAKMLSYMQQFTDNVIHPY